MFESFIRYRDHHFSWKDAKREPNHTHVPAQDFKPHVASFCFVFPTIRTYVEVFLATPLFSFISFNWCTVELKIKFQIIDFSFFFESHCSITLNAKRSTKVWISIEGTRYASTSVLHGWGGNTQICTSIKNDKPSVQQLSNTLCRKQHQKGHAEVLLCNSSIPSSHGLAQLPRWTHPHSPELTSQYLKTIQVLRDQMRHDACLNHDSSQKGLQGITLLRSATGYENDCCRAVAIPMHSTTLTLDYPLQRVESRWKLEREFTFWIPKLISW